MPTPRPTRDGRRVANNWADPGRISPTNARDGERASQIVMTARRAWPDSVSGEVIDQPLSAALT